MNRISLVAGAVLLAGTSLLSIGCTTKKTVHKEMAPLINKTNELDDLTAKNTRDIKDVDARAQKGITDVQAAAAAADQKAATARTAADEAQVAANKVSTGVEALATRVANLDNYRPVAETSVHFGFDKANLTKKAKAALDELANEVPNTKGYILTVEGGTDSVGDSQYNYGLSERRAQAVIQYLASEHGIPAHKIYVIGLGKDKPVAENKNAKGRAENRRVDVRLMTNIAEGQQQAAPAQPSQAQVQNQ
jgi:outer membrane protein OmpA-like peptidoglycan-associated protein